MQSLLLEKRYYAWGEIIYNAEQAFLIFWLCTLYLFFKHKERVKLKYMNATKVLPEELIIEIQKYVQGEALYIPKQAKEHKSWGSQSGGRQLLDQRNAEIRDNFMCNRSIEQLAEQYFLSIETIKRIVYSHQNRD